MDFAKALRKWKIEIISTGGTAALLQDNNVKVTPVSDYTGFPEILNGSVKTLHPKIYGALLAKQSDPSQVEKLKEFGISEIHMVVVNLYPFTQVIANPKSTFSEALENIDIGGISLIRAASKNYRDVVVVTDPKDYPLILSELDKNGEEISEETRLRLAVQAFSMSALYDRHISNYLYKHTLDYKEEKEMFPPILHLRYRKIRDLRYGENPHQDGALYADESVQEPSIAKATQLSGKELSFNNIYDAHSAIEIAKEFEGPAVVIVKHNNPCGVGRAPDDLVLAYQRAWEGDPVSAFGGVVACNREVTEACAQEMSKVFLEVIVAPAYEKNALSILEKKKNLRILKLSFECADQNGAVPRDKLDLKKITGGLLVQHRDLKDLELTSPRQWKIVSGNKPSEDLQEAMVFAWKVCKHVKSNAIIIANRHQVLGVGAGQMNRVDAVRMALIKAQGKLSGAALASDAFFPFRDSIDLLRDSGITAVVQPGGSLRDDEVIQAAKEQQLLMAFTATRHFKH